MQRGGDSLRIETPAKINLYLEIIGRRANGYHDLRSVVVPVSLFDTIEMEKTDGDIRTAIEASPRPAGGEPVTLPASADNLATRAAMALREATGYAGGVAIRLWKRIPLGGGLGGGSSNAAAVLDGLNRLWGTGLSRDELMRIGVRLGCDVPLFVHGGPVLMEGLGERVTPLRVGPPPGGWWVVLVNPGFCVPTKDIYERHKLALTPEDKPAKGVISALEKGEPEALGRGLFNSLEATAFRKYPLLEIVRDSLREAGALGALLSGSGASLFGLARGEAHAHALAAALDRMHGGWIWSQVVTILPDGVMAAHGPLEA